MRINSLPRYCFKQEGGGGDGVSAATSPCAVLPPVDWNRKIQSPFSFFLRGLVILVLAEINGSQGGEEKGGESGALRVPTRSPGGVSASFVCLLCSAAVVLVQLGSAVWRYCSSRPARCGEAGWWLTVLVHLDGGRVGASHQTLSKWAAFMSSVT